MEPNKHTWERNSSSGSSPLSHHKSSRQIAAEPVVCIQISRRWMGTISVARRQTPIFLFAFWIFNVFVRLFLFFRENDRIVFEWTTAKKCHKERMMVCRVPRRQDLLLIFFFWSDSKLRSVCHHQRQLICLPSDAVYAFRRQIYDYRRHRYRRRSNIISIKAAELRVPTEETTTTSSKIKIKNVQI